MNHFLLILIYIGLIGSKTSITKSPVKKAPKETFAQRKMMSDEEEERKCPTEGCDSTGHLGGRISRHFTSDACPLYHNLTPHHCKVILIIYF